MGSLKFEGNWTESEKTDALEVIGQDRFEGLTLIKKDSFLTLVSSEGLKLDFDFDQNKADYFRKSRQSQEPIFKALGYSHGIRHVVDLSMGLAIDSLFFAQQGFKVTSIERNPLLHYLAKQAQGRSVRPELKNIDFILADAKDFLNSASFKVPTSVYFDPMYPSKKKSALPRQEMVFFRSLVGSDEDAAETLQAALQADFRRVVVKRPLKAEFLAPKVTYSLPSKLVRFDVYVKVEEK